MRFGSIPTPLSSTIITAHPCSSLPFILILPPLSVNFRAFDSRFNSTCVIALDFKPPIYYGAAIGFEFTVLPPGIGDEKDVKFDITRQVYRILWVKNKKWESYIKYAPKMDIPNDDFKGQSSDNTPKNDHIYSIDVPSITANPKDDLEIVYRMNCKEFVRVRFDGRTDWHDNVDEEGEPIGGNVDLGSRCSKKVKWHVQMFLYSVRGLVWKEDPKHKTEIGLGHISGKEMKKKPK